ncbi:MULTISPECIES: carbohydrate ABC transporter permease [Paenibacillus]|jgi:putative aldouronate transport system permease protein|uniref:carbohydrate ABC transporter permease n=1 Tax=Paenibacillus TaxID=44249 RepID=UPI0004F630FD|nr:MULTISPECIES: carbohydrate ABC transporter permease [unclassified Paenibacillus]AIQ27016.1 sugar ABC transporter permease [Paenibacillus sp. FSL P4-0081]OMF29531.1 sugar ABC transporter permease [Paenibacillus sp. FSL H8-0259]
MKIKRTIGERLFDSANTLIMLLLIIITLYPLWHVLNASLSDSNRLMAHSGLLLLPDGFNLDSYKLVLSNPSILSGYRNTVVIVVLGTALNLLFTILGAYTLSRKSFMLRNPIMLAIVFTMFFNGGIIPTYLLINNTLHMGNNLMALIVPGLVSSYNLIIMRTAFQEISESLLESARIDGAGEVRILWRIVVPLSMPVIAVMILFYGVSHWNSWFSAILYIRDRNLYPLQLILREILIQNSTDSMTTAAAMGDKEAIGESVKYATVMVATLPILFIYPFLQKYFVKGVMIGAIKE